MDIFRKMNFNEKVWNACARVPRGKVTTYGAIAKALGTKAHRAVGNALHANPYAPRVPCHRVVKSDGSVGGFGGGVRKKIRMLKKEGIKIEKWKIKNFEKVFFRL